MEMIQIEGGVFEMGSDEDEIEFFLESFRYAFAEFDIAECKSWLLKQFPRTTTSVSTFWLGKYPVTNGDFEAFEKYCFGRPMRTIGRDPSTPVEGVSYFDAIGFCQWASHRDQISYRLPTEAEWEYAASSRGKFMFPWGDKFEKRMANTAESGRGITTAVNMHVVGASEQGVCDLAGNVEEWTSDVYLPYIGGEFVSDAIHKEANGLYPILRGGSYAHHADLCLASRRHGYRANYSVCGFRLASTSLNDITH
jgi:formylglycine-generating enzyme required for sulfatase activity